MGPLTIPPSSRVFVDAQIIIYGVEKHPQLGTRLQPVWDAAQAGQIQLGASELSVMETLVKPIQLGDSAIVSDFDRFFARLYLDLVPVTKGVLRAAASLRATYRSLKTPDAIQVAAARDWNATLLLTNDRDLANIPGVVICILEDYDPINA
jgi:predicted nucleic acid-binding protein